MLLQQAQPAFGAGVAEQADIHRAEADIFAPCAIGAVLNATTVPEIRASIVAGAANNQLATPEDGLALHRRGILYAPDFVANGGGIINVATEILRIGDRQRFVAEKLAALEATLGAIYRTARRDARAPSAVAEEVAGEKLRRKAA